MPGNTVKINESKNMEWYVGDSMIDSLIAWLDENGKKIEVETTETVNKMVLLDEWIKDLVFPGNPKDFILETKGYSTPVEIVRELCLFTEDHKYTIHAVDRKDDDGYLGCGAQSRRYRAGENWFRGNDLPDGPFTKETWNKILSRIVSYELVKLSEHAPPTYVSLCDDKGE